MADSAGEPATPSIGTVTVEGGPTRTAIAFGAAGPLEVVIAERGLLVGASWRVVFGNASFTASEASLHLSVPAGAYSYAISATGYVASPASGELSVSEATNWLNVTFGPAAVAPAGFTSALWIIGGAIAAAAVLSGLAAWVWIRRRGAMSLDSGAAPTI